MARKIQEINAGSMADIAFLLLIFFLVATTMNVDSGIARNLPQWVDENQPPIEYKERNLLTVMINQNNQLLVAGERMDVSGLKDKVKTFITNPTNDPSLPEKTVMEIDLLGPFPVSKGVVSLKSERRTSYSTYVAVQNELTRAISEARNDLARRRFGKSFDKLEQLQQDAIQNAIPSKISEAEPRNMTGGK